MNQNSPNSAQPVAPPPPDQKRRELRAFLFLTVVLAPLLAVVIVGGYGLMIWLYQQFAGPPTY